MKTNLAESFNAWLKNERHHSIYTFMMEHIIKLDGMLVNHKEERKHWKGSIGLEMGIWVEPNGLEWSDPKFRRVGS